MRRILETDDERGRQIVSVIELFEENKSQHWNAYQIAEELQLDVEEALEIILILVDIWCRVKALPPLRKNRLDIYARRYIIMSDVGEIIAVTQEKYDDTIKLLQELKSQLKNDKLTEERKKILMKQIKKEEEKLISYQKLKGKNNE